MSQVIDLSQVLHMDRVEVEGLNAVINQRVPAIPFKLTYDNISVHEFYTGMTDVSSRNTFNIVKDYAEREIDAAIDAFLSKDSAKTVCQYSWQIKNGFVTIDLCLHCYTEYFDDLATHRVAVSMVAYFDANRVFLSEEIFGEVTDFYTKLKDTLTK